MVAGRRCRLTMTQHQGRRPRNDVIDLADPVVLGYRVRRRLFQPAAMHPANADTGLADVDIADLLVEQLFIPRLLGIGVDLGSRDIGPRTHRAGRLRIGGVNFWLLVRVGPTASHSSAKKPQTSRFIDVS
jgi:hypothetical protein